MPQQDVRQATESPLVLQELLRKTARGDAEAFALLYRKTAGKLYAVAIRIAGRGELAEDALQECFVTIWRRAADYDPTRGAAMSWLTAIARNCTLDRLRRLGARPEGHAAPVEALERIAAPDDSERGAQMRALRSCLDELDETPRRAVLLAYLYGLTREELATHLAVPVGTVKSWIRRSLGRLKQCLDA
ncbi:MAG: sigma-70 family RNA polymerase sigma factor [Alphaproteobacteria bacterium]|nr:sigma-70 family RNA polymerase sigma factor [Alphaproteobacteria bacterium]